MLEIDEVLLPLDGELTLDTLELLPEELDDERLELLPLLELEERSELLDELLELLAGGGGGLGLLLDMELADDWLLLLLDGEPLDELDDELFEDELPELLELLVDDCEDWLLLLPLDDELDDDRLLDEELLDELLDDEPLELLELDDDRLLLLWLELDEDPLLGLLNDGRLNLVGLTGPRNGTPA